MANKYETIKSGQILPNNILANGGVIESGAVDCFVILPNSSRLYIGNFGVGDTVSSFSVMSEQELSIYTLFFEATETTKIRVLLASKEDVSTAFQISLRKVFFLEYPEVGHDLSISRIFSSIEEIVKNRISYAENINSRNDTFITKEIKQDISRVIKDNSKTIDNSAEVASDTSNTLISLIHGILKKQGYEVHQGWDVFTNRRLSLEEQLKFFAETNGFRVRSVDLSKGRELYPRVLLAFFVDEKESLSPTLLYISDFELYCYKAGEIGKKNYLKFNEPLPFKNLAYEFIFPEKESINNVGFFLELTTKVLIPLFMISMSACLSVVIPFSVWYILKSVIPFGSTPLLVSSLVFLILVSIGRLGLDIAGSEILNKKLSKELLNKEKKFLDSFFKKSETSIKNIDSYATSRFLLTYMKLKDSLVFFYNKCASGFWVILVNLFLILFLDSSLLLETLSISVISFLIFMLAEIFSIKIFSRIKRYRKNNDLILEETVKGISEVRTSNSEEKFIYRFIENYIKKDFNEKKIQVVSSALKHFLWLIPVTSVLLMFYLEMNKFETLELATTAGLLIAFFLMQDGVLKLSQGSASFVSLLLELPKIFAFQNESEVQESSLRYLNLIDGHIDINGLLFKYDNALEPVLHDIKLNILPGEFIAFVGPSGSGKSTLFRLLTGMLKPQKGQILYSGYDLNKIDLRFFRKQIGAVRQASKIFTGTIKDNIAIGTKLDDASIWQLLEEYDLADEVKKMPMGINTIIGPDRITGGLMQKILIARAMAGKPSILFLDEATSALDNIAQANIQHSISNLKITRLVIAHRFSTIKDADRIYVLENGTIKDVGTFHELYLRNDFFRESVEQQMSKGEK